MLGGQAAKEKAGLSAFTLMELIVVIIIIGVLATIAIPSYTNIRESQYAKDAVASLKLIMAAEKIYRMEIGKYFESADITAINRNLKLSLATGGQKLWDYKAVPDNDSTPQTCCVQATRTTSVAGTTPTLRLRNTDTTEPASGTCP